MLKKIIDELREKLPGSLVSKVYQPGKREILLELWKPGGGNRLLISAHPHLCSAHITGKELKNPLSPPRFCQALRKHLSGARIRDIELTEFERAFTVMFQARGEDGEPQHHRLVAELFGRHANIILLDESGIILNALNIVTERDTSVREIASGISYRPLPPLPKTFLPGVTIETCRQILTDSWDGIPQAIMRGVYGISKEIASQVAPGGDADGKALLDAFGEIIRAYREGSYRVGLRRENRDRTTLLPVIAGAVVPGEIEYFDSANEAADTFFHASYLREQFLSMKNKLLTVLRKRKKREEKKKERVNEDILKLESLKEFGVKGELLKQSLHIMKKGQKELSAPDFSTTPPRRVVIELDPSLSPVENMNRYFRLYKKGQRGISMKTGLLPRIEEEIRYLNGIQYYVEKAQTIDDLSHLEREMTESGYMRRRARKEKKRERKGKRESSAAHVEKKQVEEFTVYIGKNNRGNDHIVKSIARPGDLWLHARHHPGSHVLIKKPRSGEIPPGLIRTFGAEAARRSGGARDGKVEIFVADAKDVSKIPGQRPGMVRVRRYRTIMVETGNGSPEYQG
ncbi:MAG: DUF814 domain-containing protein [Deltaproteobacteria bacterium]|nr:DUF814 domain-containing protein [Deltaproteobacteria bacterium]